MGEHRFQMGGGEHDYPPAGDGPASGIDISLFKINLPKQPKPSGVQMSRDAQGDCLIVCRPTKF